MRPKVFGPTYETRNKRFEMDAEMYGLLMEHMIRGYKLEAFCEGIDAGRIHEIETVAHET